MDERVRTVVVEVCHAQDLMPKDGQGSASAFVEVEFDGQRKKTKTKSRELNPVWNARLVFHISPLCVLDHENVEVNVYNEKKSSRRNFLGRVRIPGSGIVKAGEETEIGYWLEKRSLFSNVSGRIYLKVFYSEEQATKKTWAGDVTHDQERMSFESGTEVFVVEQRRAGSVFLKLDKQQAASEAKKVVQQQSGSRAAGGGEFFVKETNPKVAAKARRTSRRSMYDLVESMEYLFVKVVKAKNLVGKDITGSSDPYVQVKVGNYTAKTRVVEKSLNPEWNQAFAFGKGKFQAPLLELTVKDKDMIKDDFLGYVSFDISEVPTRMPPDSPLAPQWVKLEPKSSNVKGDTSKELGELMVSVWYGTQADEVFSDAWQSDGGGHLAACSKVYLSPKLWYVRVTVIEAQDLVLNKGDVSVKVQLGAQISRTRVAANPFWNQELVFVAAEPFEEPLQLTVENRIGVDKDDVVVGRLQIPLSSVPRRLDHRPVNSQWFHLEKHLLPDKRVAEGQPNPPPKQKDSSKFSSRIHLRVCFDGGYHVLDESTHYSSGLQPSAKQLWKPSIGVLELGILGASGLSQMKTTNAYVVAKYGQKWVRSRSIVDNLAPRWNEQYTWEVYDPCTVLTIGVFNNAHLSNGSTSDKDARMGKVRIRLSTLDSDRVYTHAYPLLLLQTSGLKKMGELELAVRFSSFSLINMINSYTQPLLPKMHYMHPLGVGQLETLRNAAIKIVALRLSRAEPPLRREVVQYMLDVDSNLWSMRRSKAHWLRILSVVSGVIAVGRWFDDICQWKNTITTLMVHLLFLILVWYPELILPTLFLYMFLIGAWHYRFRPHLPSHMDPRLSQVDSTELDELDEEFDTIPTSRSQEIVKARYHRLRAVAGRIQTVLGDMAMQGERIHALLSWHDPRATSIFIVFCLFAAITLYVTPFRVVAILFGLYILRHPRFREKMPGVHMNFFRRLPTLSDRML